MAQDTVVMTTASHGNDFRIALFRIVLCEYQIPIPVLILCEWNPPVDDGPPTPLTKDQNGDLIFPMLLV